MKIFKSAIWIVSILIILACNIGTRAASPAPAASPIPPTTAPPTQVPAAIVAVTTPTTAPAPATSSSNSLIIARDKIKHVVVIMQENRSFDEYFGTYPGADGIPMQNGVPTVCSLDPQTNTCVKPYYNPNDVNSGGPHSASSATADIDSGKMDGFVAEFRKAAKACKDPDAPGCVKGQTPDVMGWHDARQIPNYWTYAQNFVLQDKMFEPNASWSLPAHLLLYRPGPPTAKHRATLIAV